MEEEQEIEEEQKEEEPSPGKKSKIIGIIKKTIKYLLILGILGAGGYFGYLYFKADENSYSHKEFKFARSNEIKLKYTFYNMKKVYEGIEAIDNELALINKEIERINAIETQYPDQKKITLKEKKSWNKLKQNLMKVLKKTESVIEVIFVTTSVNEKKGKELLEKEKDKLAKNIDDVIKQSREKTSLIKVEKDKSFIEKIKNFF